MAVLLVALRVEPLVVEMVDEWVALSVVMMAVLLAE